MSLNITLQVEVEVDRLDDDGTSYDEEYEFSADEETGIEDAVKRHLRASEMDEVGDAFEVTGWEVQ